MENNSSNIISFKIEAIELLEYSLNTPNYLPSQEVSYKFDMGIEHKISLDLKKIFVVCIFDIKSESTDEQFAHAKISCVYDLPELEKYYDTANNKVKFPTTIGVTLNSISLSTSRGVLFTLFRGTFLHHAILPIVDPKTFIPGDNN
jgi:hypothetical protein